MAAADAQSYSTEDTDLARLSKCCMYTSTLNLPTTPR